MAPKVIAFYFPQFHRIPENDEWWGQGYTEWVDVARAVPRFNGHLQPRLPTSLGFYDLADVSVQERQAELAQNHGIFGFCYYYYWFSGKKLLQRPIENMLATSSVRIPFCICFANETWTRRWDGRNDEILIRQEHRFEDDRNFIRSLIPYFRDSRYIRIDGRPLLLVYQTRLFPDAKATAAVWRNEVRQQGIGEIYLCRCESYFDFTEPAILGYDAAYQFPPHSLEPSLTEVQDSERFDGSVFDFSSCVQKSSQGRPTYKRFRGVMTGFDNSPKMRCGAWVFRNSSPERYQEWLTDALRDTVTNREPEEQVVFVNAWNEWGEGAILEPCSIFGDGHLKATAAALHSFEMRPQDLVRDDTNEDHSSHNSEVE
jgi:lipopolysaccharide biosynthesis protein